MGQKALGGSCKHVGEMGVGWGVRSLTTIGVDRVEREKVFNFAFFGGLGKCKVAKAPHLHEGLGTNRGNLWWRMKVQMGNGNYKV